MNLQRLAVVLTALVWSFSVHAEVKLDSADELIGSWILTAEAAKLEGEKKALDVVWNFQKDGVLATKSRDTFGRTKSFRVDLKYSVEDGVLRKQSSPGREKYETCSVIEKSSTDMILKCKYLYFFLQKKG
ncbi:MAG: hypothetical protein RQ715_03075 [Methylococcales bacterium]|nr:hypothetical protein [Methylococcales bacterium]